eukprot:tig00020603_g11784.t1
MAGGGNPGGGARRRRKAAPDSEDDSDGVAEDEELADDDLLEPTAAEWQRVLSESIGQATKQISRGVLLPGGQDVRVTEPRGKHFQILGAPAEDNTSEFIISTAEALYLMQLGMLEVTHEAGVPLSMQEMMALSLGPAGLEAAATAGPPRPRTMEQLTAFSRLSRMGYVALPRAARAAAPALPEAARLHFDLYKPPRRAGFRKTDPGPPDFHLFAFSAAGEAPDARQLDAMRGAAPGGAPLLAAALDDGASLGVYALSAGGLPTLTPADRVPARPPGSGRGGGRGRGRPGPGRRGGPGAAAGADGEAAAAAAGELAPGASSASAEPPSGGP